MFERVSRTSTRVTRAPPALGSPSTTAVVARASATPAVADEAGDTALLTVVPLGAPTSEAAEDLLHAIRLHAIRDLPDLDGARLSATGSTALDSDISERLADALVPYWRWW